MKQYTSLYFVGAGGIGMSALVRYFLAKGYKVAGYDRTQSPLTTELKTEGLEIVYECQCKRTLRFLFLAVP